MLSAMYTLFHPPCVRVRVCVFVCVCTRAYVFVQRCSDRYKQELEGPGVKVVIIFSSFYLVRRLSCRHEGHHHSPIRIDDHQQNREGLRQLK